MKAATIERSGKFKYWKSWDVKKGGVKKGTNSASTAGVWPPRSVYSCTPILFYLYIENNDTSTHG